MVSWVKQPRGIDWEDLQFQVKKGMMKGMMAGHTRNHEIMNSIVEGIKKGYIVLSTR